MAGRKIRDAADARACLKAEKASRAANRADWAREHGIDGRSLNAWRINLQRRRQAPGAKAARLVELVPSLAPPPETTRYTVRCGTFVIEVGEHFDEVTLGRLLRVVTSC